jgi:lipoprotein-releasing system permease protein
MGPNVLQFLIYLGAALALLVGAGVLATVWNYFLGPPFIRTLVNKYVARRKIAWIALVSVALCSALVLIVLSVMGGWLREFKRSYKTLSGDLVVSAQGQRGFANYEEMIAEIEKLPEVAGAIPIIRSVGIIEGYSGWRDYAGAVGIPMDRVQKVFRFADSLWFQQQRPALDGKPAPREPGFQLWNDIDYPAFARSSEEALKRPGMIVGAPVLGIYRDETGRLGGQDVDGLRRSWLRLTIVPDLGSIGSSTKIPAKTQQFWVVDLLRTQSQLHDNNVYVPFDVMQREMEMNAFEYQEIIDPIKGTTERRTEPARTSEIHINVKPGVDKVSLIPTIEAIIDRFARPNDFLNDNRVKTWEQQQARFLGAIEVEIAMTTALYVVVSAVAVLLIFCIFYAVVAEKLKDIGIVKSVGATNWHVTQVFLAYGAAVGFVGGAVGVGLGIAVVKNLVYIERFLSWLAGRKLWDPRTYALDLMPDHVDSTAAIVILITAIVASTLGAVLPAIRAGRLNPVEALRYE